MHLGTLHPVRWTVLGLALVALPSRPAAAAQLVTEATIQIEKNLTSVHKLKNGIPVIVRKIPDSDIVQVDVSFGTGLKDLTPGRKSLNEWLWSVVPMAATTFPKEKVFGITEKYSLELGCSGGIEYATCGLGTINDYWHESLPLFAALVKDPALTDEDAKLTKDRVMAQLRNTPSDPGEYINEIVNSIFYPVGHPYRLNSDEALKELATLGQPDLVAYHKSVVNATNMYIVVVTSMDAAKVVADLELAFGAIAPGESQKVTAEPPVFDQAHAYVFNDRDLPTAYIRIKTNAPGILDKDAVAAHLLYEILSEELGDEVRTRRSLSYAVHAFLIQYHLGIGVINASTSKPKETLEAINDVLQAIKARTYTDDELTMYKTGFATSYYLTQETHASLAGALGSAYFFYGDPNEHYELPRRLDKVTPADIKRLANQWLTDLRLGVIYGRAEFQDEWAQALIKKNLAPPDTQKSH